MEEKILRYTLRVDRTLFKKFRYIAESEGRSANKEIEQYLKKCVKEFEEKHNALVYAVTHEYTDFGECYDFLYISDYEEDWDEMLYPQGNMYYVFAYVWNKTDDWCSEFGTIGIRSFGGGIKRVA